MCSEIAIPASATLSSVWQARLDASPDETALFYEEQCWSYKDLDLYRATCRRELDWLNVQPHDRVVLLLDNGPVFLAAFLACQSVGAIPVPLSPKSSPQRLTYLLADSAAQLVLIGSDLSARTLEQHQASEYANLLVVLPSGGDGVQDGPPVVVKAEDCAVIQYTSGSTSDSKGVMISHRAILANIIGFAAEMELKPGHDLFSSLLPLFHDMGLVCFGLAPLVLGYPLALYRQESLSLYCWLEGIGKRHATITGAPDSLLSIANRVVDQPSNYPLDSLRLLVCGSEPVRAATVSAFGNRFGVTEVLKPAYGMAELTLCATITPANLPMRMDANGQVSSGRPIEGVSLCIRCEDGSITTNPGQRGEILVRSPAAMDGYWGRASDSKAVFNEDGYLVTGDIGYLDEDGWLYVVGRLKNLLIRGGEKYSPHDLESLALSEPLIRRAAVVQTDDEAARIIAVLEVDRLKLGDTEAMHKLARSFSKISHVNAGIAPDEIWFEPGGVLPTTENGKMRHAALRQSIMLNALQPVVSWPPNLVTHHQSRTPYAVDAV